MVKPIGKIKNLRTILLIAINVLLLVGLIVLLAFYDNSYQKKIHSQNVADITNINQSAVNTSAIFFTGRESKIKDVALYIENNNLTLSQSLDFISKTNSDKTKVFEIIDEDCKGYGIDAQTKAYVPIDYSQYKSIVKMVEQNIVTRTSQIVFFAPEFTDGLTATKSFALYNIVNIRDESGKVKPYVLMVVSETAAFNDLLNINSNYSEISTVVTKKNGDYIIGNSNFKSENVYHYLYLFNGLTLDEQKEVKRKVVTTGKTNFTFNDSKGRENVFVFAKVPHYDWYCVSAVPTDSFVKPAFDITYSLIIAITLIVMFALDFAYLFVLNRRMKVSVENEVIASNAKTEFLSNMSHDIRTPLNVIIGMAMIAGEEDNPPETKECLENIDRSGKFLLGLVNDILDLNKVESGKMEIFSEPYRFKDFSEYISAVILPLAKEKEIEFSIESNVEDGYALLDKLRFNQIFFNLLSNAVKYTPEGGTVKLVCGHELLPDKKVKLKYEVQDNGMGMTEDFQHHMFEAFSQEHRKEARFTEGTGLGLSIVNNLVKLMGGELGVESKIGHGSRFTVTLKTSYIEDIKPQVSEETDYQLLKNKRVLLCEDQPLNAKIASRLLESKGITVERAENGSVGVEMFAASKEKYYDAVLMDIRMPVMDGLSATRNIRALERSDAKTVPIIAMTANAYDTDVKNSLNAGMNAHLAKPIDTKMLYQTLTNVFNSNL